ncbi:MAG: hypothetical protein RMJ98_21920 [Myxococcales bacterium]|nr:TerB family tellurite resistance protein [Polyangiaceae bacterium]MDW8251963.1 hypothetical protein [Myxococcales bacterium]
MTPAEMRVLKSLVAVMWADGKVEGAESSVLEGLIAGFGASDEEEAEILSWAKTPRTLDDVPLNELTQEDRELLLGNAALITLADGEQSASEKEVLQRLVKLLGFSAAKAQEIIDSSRDGVIQLGTKPLEDLPNPPPLRKKLPGEVPLSSQWMRFATRLQGISSYTGGIILGEPNNDGCATLRPPF